MRRKMLTDKQLASIRDRSTKRMLTHQSWITSAVNETGRRYGIVPRESKSRKPLPEWWPTYERIRGGIIDLSKYKMPKRRVSRK